MKKFIIDEELLVGIINYLKERPFMEVSGLMNAIQTKIVELKEEENEKEDMKPKPKKKSE